MRRHDLSNLASLAAIQVSNAALPLLLFPYTLAVVGADKYSQIVITEALALIVLAVVLYSFEVDGVGRVVGLDPDTDADRISDIFSGILWTRLALFGAAATVMLGLASALGREVVQLVSWWLLLPLGYILQSLWLFQGLERNQPAAMAIVTSRILCVWLVLVLVREPGDHALVPALIGACTLVAGSLSLGYVILRLRIRVTLVPLARLSEELRNGREIFVGNASVLLYRDLNVLLLTVAGGSQGAISAYSLAEKVVKSIQASIRPMNQLFFPKAMLFAGAAHKASREVLRGLMRLTAPQLTVLALVVVALGLAYGVLNTRVVAVAEFPLRDEVATLVAVMTAAVFFGVANFMFGTAGLNQLGERRYLMRSLAGVGVFSVAACSVLARLLGSAGAAAAFVLSEVLLFGLIVRRYAVIGR